VAPTPDGDTRPPSPGAALALAPLALRGAGWSTARDGGPLAAGQGTARDGGSPAASGPPGAWHRWCPGGGRKTGPR